MKFAKTFVALTALVAVSLPTFAVPTQSQSLMTQDEATQLALQIMPRGSEHISTKYDEDDKAYEVKFHSGGTREKFEVNVDAQLRVVEELESETYIGFDENAKNKVKKNDKYKPNLSLQEIITLVEKTYAGAVVEEIELEKDNGFWVYEVGFKGTHVEGLVEIDPETGKTMERDLKFVNIAITPDIPTTLPSDEIVEGVFTENQAIQKIYNMLPRGTTFVASKRVIEDQSVSYEVTFTYKEFHIQITVDGATGSIKDADVFSVKEVDKKAPNRYENGRYVAKYTPDQIAKVALDYFSDGEIEAIQMGLSRNLWVYDVDVKLVNGRADLLICPETANLLALDLDVDTIHIPTHPILPPVEETIIPSVPTIPAIPVQPEGAKVLTEQQVRGLVKKLVPNGEIVEIKLDKDDDEWVYEIKVIDKNYEYDIEIDAKTGKTLDFEQEELDDDDDDDDDDDERDDD